MSINLGRRLYQIPGIPIALTGPRQNCRSVRFVWSSERSLCSLTVEKNSKIRSLALRIFQKSSLESGWKALTTTAAVAKSERPRTKWDEAADAYFSEGSEKKTANDASVDNRAGKREREGRAGGTTKPEFKDSNSSDSWERNEKEAFGRLSKSTSNGTRSERSRGRETTSSGREFKVSSEGVKRWGSAVDKESKGYKKSGEYVDRNGRGPQWQKAGSGAEGKDFRNQLRYGAETNGTIRWQNSARIPRSREDGSNSSQNANYSRTRSQNSETLRNQDRISGGGRNARETTGWEGEKGSDEGVNFREYRRWPARESSPLLEIEGQTLYGTAPILGALQACRRKFHSLYIQENLLQNLEKSKRKDKAAVLRIEKTVKSMGVTVKEASKHDLNMLVDNRPHQGLVLDASPLEMVPVDMLEQPSYEGRKTPVWVALDEVTDPQNFGAILRSAYFLGAEGVVVCAKNSAPLSGVVSKASAGAMEVMEVQFCKNMVKFLDKCRGNGWRVVGASAGSSSVPVRELPPGIATILVLGSEGRGMRTNVKRACDQLVSIDSILNDRQRPNVQDLEGSGYGLEDEDEDEDGDEDGEGEPK